MKRQKVFRIFAGKKTGQGSIDKEGFSSNGEFMHYLAPTKKDAIKKFNKENRGYVIYDILFNR